MCTYDFHGTELVSEFKDVEDEEFEFPSHDVSRFSMLVYARDFLFCDVVG